MFGMTPILTFVVLIVAVVMFFGTIREIVRHSAKAQIAKWEAEKAKHEATTYEGNDYNKHAGL